MEKMRGKFCPALWLSGFFGLAALAHLVRLTFRWGMQINGHEIPLALSCLVVIVMGTLSAGLGVAAIKRPCDSKKNSECCTKL